MTLIGINEENRMNFQSIKKVYNLLFIHFFPLGKYICLVETNECIHFSNLCTIEKQIYYVGLWNNQIIIPSGIEYFKKLSKKFSSHEDKINFFDQNQKAFYVEIIKLSFIKAKKCFIELWIYFLFGSLVSSSTSKNDFLLIQIHQKAE